MMTFQVNALLPTTQTVVHKGSSTCGPDAVGYPTYRNFRMGAGGGRAAFRQNSDMRRKFPMIQHMSKSRDGKALVSGIVAAGSPNMAKDDSLESENTDLQEDIGGRHFLFDKKWLERTRTAIPPMPRDFHVHRPGDLNPFGLSQELSHSHSQRPFTLGFSERYEMNKSPALLFPSTLVLNGRNTFSVQNCKLSRPKVYHPMYNLQTVKDNQKSQSYPDPMVGASRSFIHRISELSCLEAETVRKEKLKKMRKPKKPPS